MSNAYLHYDVFTTAPLTGNQLAVFYEPPIWRAETMQAIAREMNFAETTFVYPPQTADGTALVRIFTPGGELPMAGHPTIGTTFALAKLGRIEKGVDHIVLELGIGPTRVDLEWDSDGSLKFAWMTQPVSTFTTVFENRSEVARTLGLTTDDLVPGLPVQIVSSGVPWVFIPLKSAELVDRVELDRGGWQRLCASMKISEQKVFVFAVTNASSTPIRIHSRMFAPIIGVPEDPGTGGASGPLGAYLVRHDATSGEICEFVSHQGVKMQRPCEISIRITSKGSEITRVQIGGTAFLAGEATLNL